VAHGAVVARALLPTRPMSARGFTPCLIASAFVTVAACSDDSTPLPTDGGLAADASPRADAGAGLDAGDAADLGPRPDGGALGSGPILLRPSLDRYRCETSRGRTELRPRFWGSSGHALATTTAGRAFLARVESTPASPFEPAPAAFLVSPMAADGTIGAGLTPSSGPADTISEPALARDGDGLALAWVEAERLLFARLDADGARRAAPEVLVEQLDSFGTAPRVAAGTAGFGVLYGRGQSSGAPELWFVGLDAAGRRRAAPVRIDRDEGTFIDPAAAIVADGDGYALAWRTAVSGRAEIAFQRLDASGAARGARRILTTSAANETVGAGAGFDRARVALLAVDGGFVAAWTSIRSSGAGFEGVSVAVMLARLGPDGALVGEPAPLRAGELDVDEVEPGLTAFADGVVAVTWARGTHIYICGGCIPDHRIDLVLVDAATLSPVSGVATIERERTGGLLRRQVAVLGDTLLTTFGITFHVHEEPGSASFRCVAR
jgi:hypothetical protein